MLETKRPWSGGEQRRNFVGLGAYEIPFLFLYIWIYVCCWLGGQCRRCALGAGSVRSLVVHWDLQFTYSILTMTWIGIFTLVV